ncbi:Ser/Thr protein phosphatase superfamily [Thozetella sp. PMI_491]|nr:Ser/Thr protein phosphatase superfamily [Thozetella sp. PMI_491]
MAVQILSDLHLEAPKAYDIFEIIPKAPYLALLGDIGCVAAQKDDYLAFLTRQLKQFKALLLVPGNHEAYKSSWEDTLEILRAFEQDTRNDPSLGEFILLDRTVYRLPETDTVILGCNNCLGLFSCIPRDKHIAVGMGLNDFYATSNWTTDTHNDMHHQDVAWLNTKVRELEHSDVNIMIFTHWSPSQDPRTIDPKHARSSITSGFATDMSGHPCFTSRKVKVWAFGHTHYNCDLTLNRDAEAEPLRLITNQRGYYFAQAEGFDGERTVAL